MLSAMFLPSYRQEFEPVPITQAMPSLFLQSARAAPKRSLATFILAFVKCSARMSLIMLHFISVAQPAP